MINLVKYFNQNINYNYIHILLNNVELKSLKFIELNCKDLNK